MKYIYKWEYIRHKICAAFMTLSNIWKKVPLRPRMLKESK